jgi:MFS family permease
VGAGLNAYRQVLADPRARAFTAAGLVARLPMSMTGIGIVLLVSLTSGSFGRAGLVTAVGTVTGAIAAPLWGRVIDRVGQARVLVTAALVNSASMTLLIISVLEEWPLVVSLLAAVGVGVGFSSAGSCVRARWSHRLKDSPLLNTAFAVEAVFDEVVFIVGPVLVTLLATTWHPALGVGVAAALGLIGALALAVQRQTQPPPQPRSSQGPRTRMPVGTLLAISAACFALGGLFGAMEVAVVAFAQEAGVLGLTGVILMCWAAGSLLSGVVTGTITWRASPARRFRIGALALALSLVPLPFVDQPIVMAGLLAISGMAIAPTLIASVAVTQEAVLPNRLTEALGWTSTGLAGGVAAGAAGVGWLIDYSGSTAGFWGVVGFGLLLIIAAVFVRSSRPTPVEPGLSSATTGSPATEPERPSAETPSR